MSTLDDLLRYHCRVWFLRKGNSSHVGNFGLGIDLLRVVVVSFHNFAINRCWRTTDTGSIAHVLGVELSQGEGTLR